MSKWFNPDWGQQLQTAMKGYRHQLSLVFVEVTASLKLQRVRGTDLPVPVLENDTYATSLKKKKQRKKCRFATASSMIDQYDPSTSPVSYAFDILDRVALSGSWSIVYDIVQNSFESEPSTNTV